MDSGATAHMVKTEENMMNLKNSEIKFTVGDIRTLAGGNVAIGTAIRDGMKNP